MTLPATASPLIPSELVPEIRGTLAESRQSRAAEPADQRSTPEQRLRHEESVMLDVTLALIIRHRLPIDADAAAKAVRKARPDNLDDIDNWARGCAEHIASLTPRTIDEGL